LTSAAEADPESKTVIAALEALRPPKAAKSGPGPQSVKTKTRF
jgi:hypothetical protein